MSQIQLAARYGLRGNVHDSRASILMILAKLNHYEEGYVARQDAYFDQHPAVEIVTKAGSFQITHVSVEMELFIVRILVEDIEYISPVGIHQSNGQYVDIMVPFRNLADNCIEVIVDADTTCWDARMLLKLPVKSQKYTAHFNPKEPMLLKFTNQDGKQVLWQIPDLNDDLVK